MTTNRALRVVIGTVLWLSWFMMGVIFLHFWDRIGRNWPARMIVLAGMVGAAIGADAIYSLFHTRREMRQAQKDRPRFSDEMMSRFVQSDLRFAAGQMIVGIVIMAVSLTLVNVLW